MAGIKYSPLPPPQDVNDLPRYLEQELQRMADLMNDHQMRTMGLDPLGTAPNNPSDGDVAYSTGAWGTSQGLHEYITGTGWVKL